MKNLTRHLFISFLFVFFAGNIFAATRDTGTSEYRAGVQAFNSGDYVRALRHFETARKQGKKDPNLTYNLAVTHYKLKQFVQAKQLFRDLMMNRRYRDLARYNLGLVAMQQGNNDEAERLFREMRRTSDDRKLAYLAERRLEELGHHVKPSASTHPPRNWLALLNLAGGYNDNPLAYPELQLAPATTKDDTFVQFLGYGQTYLKGQPGNGLRLHGFVYTKQYLDTNIVDVTTAEAGLTSENTFSDWRYAYGGDVGYSQIDGNTLTTRIQGSFKIERSLGNNEYRLRFQPAYHIAGNRYSYLEGWQHRIEFRWRTSRDNMRWTARYRFEYNNRDDVRTATTFLSFSPIRNSILLEANWYATTKLTITADGEYTNSQYSGKNQLTDIDGIFKVRKRKADKIEARIRGEYKLSPHWQAQAEYEYINNSENLKLYKYKSNEIKVAIEFLY